MTVSEVVAELEALGTPQTKKMWMKYGAHEPCFGVKVQDMKKIIKRVKGDHQLALDLYTTGIADAMYLAGLLVDDSRMTEAELEHWLKTASPGWVADFTVPWVVGSSPHARTLALRWMSSTDENTAAAGWSSYSSWLTITPDRLLDMEEISMLLRRAKDRIHHSPDRVKAAMNQFVAFVGCYVAPLHEEAMVTAEAIGSLIFGKENSCHQSSAVDQIAKFVARGTVGKKRRSAKC